MPETNLEARLAGLQRPAMPPDMAERIRARLRAGTAPAPSPVPSLGPLPFLARKYRLTPAQQWAFLAVLLTLAVGLLTQQFLVFFDVMTGYCKKDAGQAAPAAIASATRTAISPNRPCADCHTEKFMRSSRNR